MQEDLEAAKVLAVKAGAILLKYYSEPVIRRKGRGEPVTEADRCASAFLMKELKGLFPDDGILSEEEADDPGRADKSRVWIVDPLDGTVEFIGKIDEFAVMIGLSIEGISSLGVVYQPTTAKMYYAEMGSGAFLVENRTTRLLQVSLESDLAAMTIALSRSHPSAEVDAVRKRLGIPNATCSGSLGLKTGLICEGRAHVYLHAGSNTSIWDTCAPDIILREAGGRMTDMFNAALRYNVPDVRNRHGVVASNGTAHDPIVAAVRSVVQSA